VTRERGVISAVLRRPGVASETGAASASTSAPAAPLADDTSRDVAIVVFSGDLDKVLAALVIANGAVAMGGRASLFFTFWGLYALKVGREGGGSPFA
jgi:hypothetical protein